MDMIRYYGQLQNPHIVSLGYFVNDFGHFLPMFPFRARQQYFGHQT